jgi:upstream-binding transcription factor
MATVTAGSKKAGARGRKALATVLDNEANISAGKSDAVHSSAQKAKRAPSRRSKAKAAAASPVAAPADEMAELQGMLERLRLEKEKAEEMVRERDEVIRRKEEEIVTREKEQGRLQAELRKVQRAKEFKPTLVRETQIFVVVVLFSHELALISFHLSLSTSEHPVCQDVAGERPGWR